MTPCWKAKLEWNLTLLKFVEKTFENEKEKRRGRK